jgi:hypothetical protein
MKPWIVILGAFMIFLGLVFVFSETPQNCGPRIHVVTLSNNLTSTATTIVSCLEPDSGFGVPLLVLGAVVVLLGFTQGNSRRETT